MRRVVEMKRGKLLWHIDVGETHRHRVTGEAVQDEDAYAREIAEEQSASNGGRWKFVRILDRFPHEPPDDEPDT